eukprot:Mrub_07073.p2 GENE.Mrub_07073~~Mrub_07073.p2  ORF type:complete len:102 (-),score=4.73 Mrub_07073:591-896(-)
MSPATNKFPYKSTSRADIPAANIILLSLTPSLYIFILPSNDAVYIYLFFPITISDTLDLWSNYLIAGKHEITFQKITIPSFDPDYIKYLSVETARDVIAAK